MTPDWEDYQVLLEVSRRGSLTAASLVLDMAPATVKRRIERLQAALGGVLVEGAGRDIRLTAKGLQALETARTMERAAQAFLDAARSERQMASGVVRVAADSLLVEQILAPCLARLARSHPEIEVDVTAIDTGSQSETGDQDIRISLGDADLTAEGLGLTELGLFAHAQLLRGRGSPKDVAAVRALPLVLEASARSPWSLRAQIGDDANGGGVRLRTDSLAAQFDAIRAGLGAGLCSVRLAEGDPSLIRIAPWISIRAPVWLSLNSDQRGVRRVSVVADAMRQGARGYLEQARLAA